MDSAYPDDRGWPKCWQKYAIDVQLRGTSARASEVSPERSSHAENQGAERLNVKIMNGSY